MYVASPVIDFDVGVSGGVVLEAHELQVEHRRKTEEDDALLCFLQ